MTLADKQAALGERFELYITQLDYGRGEWQVCDGSGRDGFVLASGVTMRDAINTAYAKYIGGHSVSIESHE